MDRHPLCGWVAGTRGVAVVVVLSVSVAFACGGSTGAGLPAMAPDTAKPAMSVRAYLREIGVATAVTRTRERIATRRLAAVAGHPTEARGRAAASAARSAASAARQTAAATQQLESPAALRAGNAALVRSYRLAALGLESVARAVGRKQHAGKADGRRMLEVAARLSVAWESTVRAATARVPLWAHRQSNCAQRLSRAAELALSRPTREPPAPSMTTFGLQRQLANLGYLPPGYSTGSYDYRTTQAVMAFQGWEGILRDGVAGPITRDHLQTATTPRPWASTTRHMELHLTQQVLLLLDNGGVVRAIHVSTAAPGHSTPTGTFHIYRKERMSWSVPFQVWMPYASYFVGGYALHEYPDVPPYPASHGCVRVPAGDAEVVWTFAKIGTPLVIG